ncbi:enoyl-CoA hydratase-related protein [Streptomyces sp. NPDC046985]|uniref:enoyl-CoA hydratase-related protein n=1 Tax=Streptomyces sp. NPDC046985 TaxID=3155377 RepID=UPI003406E692
MTPVSRTRTRAVETLSLDAVDTRNALSAALVADLSAALADCARDPGVRAVVLTHTGNTFCAGADLRDPPAPDAMTALLRLILELPKPVVARITGHVRAGGLGLVGACDLAAASAAASFAFTEVRIGVAPALISLPLIPRADPRALARYCLTGERFGAAEAVRAGLITLAADAADGPEATAAADGADAPDGPDGADAPNGPDGADAPDGPDGVDHALAPVLDGLRRSAPEALAATKRLLTARVLETFDRDAAEVTALSARLFSTAQAREGMTAFLERRDAAWVV